ncbi:Stp1/IreP family PP2C-type Ser/Thr phosphatase [Brevibacillus fluminis]|uniref:Stp1/IreP family PP2C-type Ser/Thr phosphatase n=1 Tax=Brevibacillus fluminis TaxID=511487 RepID=A0A3M8DSZ6_9BACL|nr:Stp1/IreP family PP2C-type Ser/Thr phosphatase [Brevibacillus fluminis]RNB91310.1 Stp1/IreP family PP2C-type Ser/Thr phosphatase [Brevibacillus fluminis]
MEIAMKSHVGCIRQLNEDFYACTVDDHGRVFSIVADGMGGHQAGDVASRMAVEGILRELSELEPDLEREDARERLMHAMVVTNEAVYRHALENPECNGMGTTVVCALIDDEGGVLAHVGDSRIYLYTADGLKQQTEDHTLVHELMKSGQITSEQAAVHPQRNVIMRALGTEKDVRVDLGEFRWEQDDVLLLCSDGLTNKVSKSQIESLLGSQLPLKEQIDALVQHALDAGGEDNVTVVAVRNRDEAVNTGRKEG